MCASFCLVTCPNITEEELINLRSHRPEDKKRARGESSGSRCKALEDYDLGEVKSERKAFRKIPKEEKEIT